MMLRCAFVLPLLLSSSRGDHDGDKPLDKGLAVSEHPEPDYKALQGYLPAFSEHGEPMCDPCARKYVFVLSAGRAGSTTMRSMLNELPNFAVLDEWHPMLFTFGEMLEAAAKLEAMLFQTRNGLRATEDKLTSVDFACWAQDWFDRHFINPGKGPVSQWNSTRVVRGFKLINVHDDRKMTQLKSLFPCARFMYNYRENITSYDRFKSFQDGKFLEDEQHWMKKWATEGNPWRRQAMRVPLESVGLAESWNEIVAWLGLPKCHVNFVLHHNAHQNYNLDNRTDSVHCDGDGTKRGKGDMGDWGSDHWLTTDGRDSSPAESRHRRTPHPEPKYSKLKSILRPTIKRDLPMCDPCERKYVFILTTGHSGSKTLRHMLNSLPKFEMASEDHPMVYVFGEMMKVTKSIQGKIMSSTTEFWKRKSQEEAGQLTSVDFACWAQDWLDRHVSPDGSLLSMKKGLGKTWGSSNVVRGFELRTAFYDQRMAELKSLFPCARFIYNYKENVEENSSSEDASMAKLLQDEKQWMKKWSSEANDWRDQTWQFPLERFEDEDYWNRLLQWLGLRNCHVNLAFQHRSDGTVELDNTADPVECQGDGVLHDGHDLGEWDTKDWLM